MKDINGMLLDCGVYALRNLYGSTFISGQGHKHAAVLFIGEAPGENEDREGVPFVGRAGQVLNKHIKEYLGLTRASIRNKCSDAKTT